MFLLDTHTERKKEREREGGGERFSGCTDVNVCTVDKRRVGMTTYGVKT